MSKGTASKGKHSKGKSHVACRRCGGHSFHVRKTICSSCGYGKNSKMRKYSWNSKRVAKKTTKK